MDDLENPEDLEAAEDEEQEFLAARLESVSISQMGFVVFLKHGSDPRALPIFIGNNEAQSIALALNRQPPPRPMTHDLLKDMLESLDCAISRVEITRLKDNTFFARVYMNKAGVEEMEFDARPSDAIALALRWQAPIFVSRRVFEEAAVAETKTEGEAPATAKQDEPSPAPHRSPLEQLQEALERAVLEERYEEAARLRDDLNKLQNGN